MEKFQKAMNAKVVDALDVVIRARGRGSISELERVLNVETGWWHYRAENKVLRLHELFAILDHLGLDPGEFLLGQLRDDLNLDIGLDRPSGEPPALVARAWERFRVDEGERRFDDAFFTDLNEKAYRDPRAALDLISPLVDLAAPADLPDVLEIAGSANRRVIALDAADHCLQAAVELAHLLGRRKKVGNLLRRYSYVIADRGEIDRARRVVQVAVAILLSEDDQLGLAKACVEMGQWLGYGGRLLPAISAFRSALRRLPESEGRYRIAALQNLGLYLTELDRPAEALALLDEAHAYASAVSRGQFAKLRWLEAGIHDKLGEIEKAIELLESVVSTLRTEHAGEAAIATCDLVRLQLRVGRLNEAYRAALTTRALVEPLAGNKVISAAIAELLRGERTGLTLALVERVRLKMVAARKESSVWKTAS